MVDQADENLNDSVTSRWFICYSLCCHGNKRYTWVKNVTSSAPMDAPQVKHNFVLHKMDFFPLTFATVSCEFSSVFRWNSITVYP